MTMRSIVLRRLFLFFLGLFFFEGMVVFAARCGTLVSVLSAMVVLEVDMLEG